MNKFKVEDWVECVNAGDFEGGELTQGKLYQIRGMDGQATVSVINDEGTLAAYYVSRFKLYQPQENNMSMKMYDNSVEQCIKEFLKRLECVLYHDITVASMLDVNVEGDLYLEGDITTIYGVDDIYTYINNSYDQLTSQAAQKRKLELLDKKAKLDVELAQINKELEGL